MKIVLSLSLAILANVKPSSASTPRRLRADNSTSFAKEVPSTTTVTEKIKGQATTFGRKPSTEVEVEDPQLTKLIVSFSSSNGLSEVESHVKKIADEADKGDVPPLALSGDARYFRHPQKAKGKPAATLGYVFVDTQGGKAMKAAALELLALDGVSNVEFDSMVYLSKMDNIKTPSSSSSASQLHAGKDDSHHRTLAETRPWGIDMINITQLWDTTPEKTVKICVVDSGYDLGHPDLPNTETHGVTGWAAAGVGEWDVDEDTHGTHVAGTIGAIGDNTAGVLGVMPKPTEFSFHIAKVLDANGQGSLTTVMNGVSSCIDADADVINMSLGGGGPIEAFDSLCKDAYNEGILVVATAGNDGSTVSSYPASYASVMSVASVAEGGGEGSDTYGELSDFSQFNDQIEIAAPGSGILSTVPGGSYAFYSGTSMAAPHIAGAGAFLMSRFPICSNNQIRNAMIQSVREPPTSDSRNAPGWDQYYGWGIINVGSAYELLQTGCAEAGGVNPGDMGRDSLSAMALGGRDQKTYGCISEEQCDGIPVSGAVADHTCSDNTCLAVLVPTAAPTPCIGKVISINVLTDNWPGETSWSLTDTCTGDEVDYVPPGTYTDSGETYTHEYCVSGGEYEFIIFDDSNDGICCEYGSGSYSVTYDGTIVKLGGEFGYSEATRFGSCPTMAPTKSTSPSLSSSPSAPPSTSMEPTIAPTPCNGKMISINVLTDLWPGETSWTLTDTCTGDELDAVYRGAYTDPGRTYTHDYCVSKSEYEFIINDGYGDGICCSDEGGYGSYSVTSDGFEVASGGDFDSSEATRFGVCDLCQSGKWISITVVPDYPHETSWELTNTCTGDVQESASLERYDSASTSFTDDFCVPEAEYEFVISDSSGDGLCCAFGPGSYSVTYDKTNVALGGEFSSSEVTSFGSCPPPTVAPTSSASPTVSSKSRKKSGKAFKVAEDEHVVFMSLDLGEGPMSISFDDDASSQISVEAKYEENEKGESFRRLTSQSKNSRKKRPF